MHYKICFHCTLSGVDVSHGGAQDIHFNVSDTLDHIERPIKEGRNVSHGGAQAMHFIEGRNVSDTLDHMESASNVSHRGGGKPR